MIKVENIEVWGFEHDRCKFPSCREASDWCGASRQHINRVCRGERKHTGKHPITGELLEWGYIDDIG